MGELLSSLLVAIPLAALLSLLVLVLGGISLDGAASTWTLYAWLVCTTVGGAWATLVPAKMWEGGPIEQVWRRLALLATGLALGAGSWAAADHLLIDWSHVLQVGPGTAARDVFNTGETSATAFVAYMALLFVALRWWRLADPLRPTRLSLFAAASCALWAWVLQWFWAFPQPWGVMLAASIAIVVQLAAPLFPAEQRALLRREMTSV